MSVRGILGPGIYADVAFHQHDFSEISGELIVTEAQITALSADKITSGTINAHTVTIDTGGVIKSADFVTGPAGDGWQLSAGLAEFNNITVRGIIVTGAGSDVDWTHLSNISVTNADIVSLAADKITAGTIGVHVIKLADSSSSRIESFDGTSLIIRGDGSFVATSGTFTGAITATSGTLANLSVTGTLTMGTSGVFRTAPSGQRIEITEADNDRIKLITADNFEASGGTLRSIVIGTDGTTRQLTSTLFAPFTTGDAGGTFVDVRTESENDSSLPPQILFGYTGGSAQTPEFKLQNDMKLMLENGSSAAPSLTFNTDSDAGVYLAAAGFVGMASGGFRGMSFFNASATEARMYGLSDASWISYIGGATDQWRMAINSTLELTLGGTGFLVPNVYNTDTSGGSTVFVDSDGKLHRDTSRRARKADVTDASAHLAGLRLTPVKHRTARQPDSAYRYTLVAEDVAAVDPLLATWEDGKPDNWIDRGVIAHLVAKVNDLTARLESLEQHALAA